MGQEWSPPYIGPLPIPIGGNTRRCHYHHSISTGRHSKELTSLPIAHRPIVSAVSDPATQATPENRPDQSMFSSQHSQVSGGQVLFRHYTVNDPFAGSPTKTLLRLLLPLNDQVWASFQHNAATRRWLRRSVRRPH